MDYPVELQYLQRKLKTMTHDYDSAVGHFTVEKDDELMEFHARRLVEMAGNIIMGYLLMGDAKRDNEYQNAAEVFIKRAEAENKEKLHYIYETGPRDLGLVKQ